MEAVVAPNTADPEKQSTTANTAGTTITSYESITTAPSHRNDYAETTPSTTADDDHDDDDANPDQRHRHDNHDNRKKTKPFVYVAAATAALGALVFGYSLTGAGGSFVNPAFRQHFGWPPTDSTESTATDEALITALQSVGSIFGAVINPSLIDHKRLGRRYTIFWAAFVFSIGAALQCSAPVMSMLLVGRFVGGFGIGMLAMTVPVYIGEIAPTRSRGQLVTFWQVGVTVGMLLGTAVNAAVYGVSWGWRISYGGNILFAVVLMLAAATYLPESPRFLAARASAAAVEAEASASAEAEEGGCGNRSNSGDTTATDDSVTSSSNSELERTLRRLRYDDEIDHATDAIVAEIEEERVRGVASWSEIFRRNNNGILYRVLLGMAMQFLNQLSGNESINFYAPVILDRIFSDSQSLLNSFLLGVVNLVAVIIALFTVDRFGRVPLWIWGGVVMVLAQIGNSVLQSIENPSPAVDNAFLACLAIFSFAYHGTMGPLAWDICAEMFPVRERGKAVGLTTMSNFVGVVLVGSVFSFAIEASPAGSFAFFTVMLFLNICLVYFFLPETAERSPAQIEEQFRTHKPKLLRKIL